MEMHLYLWIVVTNSITYWCSSFLIGNMHTVNLHCTTLMLAEGNNNKSTILSYHAHGILPKSIKKGF